MSKNRALRRHHKNRMRARCRRRLRIFWNDCRDVTDEDIERWAKFRTDTYTICSCLMCRNPRRQKGIHLTLHELRSLKDFHLQLLEVGL